MQTKWTAGPWRVEGRKVIAGLGFSGVVAEVHEPDTAEGAANARLIAAAPDMVALLERVAAEPCIVGCNKPLREPWPICFGCDARALVARVKGE